MGFIITIIGLALSATGSILLGWTIIQPRIWIKSEKRLGKQIEAVLDASKYADKKHPNNNKIATNVTNKVAHIYLEDLKQRAAQMTGYWAVVFIAIGFIFQVIGLVLLY